MRVIVLISEVLAADFGHFLMRSQNCTSSFLLRAFGHRDRRELEFSHSVLMTEVG
jgi:hypothetical protein